MKMRLQVYNSLFTTMEANPENAIDDDFHSTMLPTLLVENERNRQLYTCAYDEMNESYVDRFIIKAVQEMLFESGVQQVSQECISTLSTLMKLSIQNIGSYLRTAVIHFPISTPSSPIRSSPVSSDSSSLKQSVATETRVLYLLPYNSHS